MSILQSDCKRLADSLLDLSNDELDEIINNDEKIEELLNSAEQGLLKEIQNQKETVIATNESMAEYNLSKEPDLIEGREKIQKLSEEGEELSNRIQEKLKTIRDKNGDMSLETALALLQTAASEMEEESDAIAKKFMDEAGELEEFLEDFLQRRKIMHLRLIKAEKMSKILSRDPSLNYMNAPPVNINSNYFPGIPSSIPNSVPYPTGSVNMPMPPPPMSYFQNHY